MLGRIVARYLLARAQLVPVLTHIKSLANQGKFDDALDMLDIMLNRTLQLRVTRSSETVHVMTEWFSSMLPDEQQRFMDMAQYLMNLRNGLMRKDLEMVHTQARLAEPDLAWVESIHRDSNDAITHGQFKVTLTHRVVEGEALEQALGVLDHAATTVAKHFPQVLYGKVYVMPDLKPKGTYDPSPHSGGLIAGSYVAATDVINLSLYARPERGSLETLIHEFGHRYHTRFLQGDLREKFIELSTVGDVQVSYFKLDARIKAANEYIALLREHRVENYPDDFLSEKAEEWVHHYPRDEWKRRVVPLLRKFRDDKDDAVEDALRDAMAMSNLGGNVKLDINESSRQPLAASMYGMTSWQENFAEAFLAYCTGKALPKELREFMAAL